MRLLTVLITFWLANIAAVCKGQLYQFTCFQEATYEYNHRGDTIWVDAKYPVIIDFEKKQVDLANKSAMNYEITNFGPLRQENDGNTITCKAIDKEGNICKLELKMFKERSYHIATLVIRYATLIHSYRLQQLSPARK